MTRRENYCNIKYLVKDQMAARQNILNNKSIGNNDLFCAHALYYYVFQFSLSRMERASSWNQNTQYARRRKSIQKSNNTTKKFFNENTQFV